jgi:copper chaperone
MQTIKFKTNIKCSGCIAKVTPKLNQVIGINKWNVDITDPMKVLTIENQGINPNEIVEALKEVGYHAEVMDKL